jgi:hypothetical protein
MTHDDCVEISATSKSEVAFARMRRRKWALGASRCGTSPFRRIDERRSRETRDRHHDRGGSFPACKALKTHKMRKESRILASQSPMRADIATRRSAAAQYPGVLDPSRATAGAAIASIYVPAAVLATRSSFRRTR